MYFIVDPMGSFSVTTTVASNVTDLPGATGPITVGNPIEIDLVSGILTMSKVSGLIPLFVIVIGIFTKVP